MFVCTFEALPVPLALLLFLLRNLLLLLLLKGSRKKDPKAEQKNMPQNLHPFSGRRSQSQRKTMKKTKVTIGWWQSCSNALVWGRFFSTEPTTWFHNSNVLHHFENCSLQASDENPIFAKPLCRLEACSGAGADQAQAEKGAGKKGCCSGWTAMSQWIPVWVLGRIFCPHDSLSDSYMRQPKRNDKHFQLLHGSDGFL